MTEKTKQDSNELDVSADLPLLLAMEKDKLEKLKKQANELKLKEVKNDKSG